MGAKSIISRNIEIQSRPAVKQNYWKAKALGMVWSIDANAFLKFVNRHLVSVIHLCPNTKSSTKCYPKKIEKWCNSINGPYIVLV